MNTTVEIIKACLPLVGVVIGIIFTQWLEKNRVAREDKKKIKRTIFYLLELRYQLNFLLAQESETKLYYEIVKRKFALHTDLNQVDEKTFHEIIKAVGSQISSSPLTKPEELKQMNDNYAKCIDNLSEVYPILAFRLHGRQNMSDLLNEAVSRLKQISLSVTSEQIRASDISEFETGLSKLKPNLLNRVMSDMEEILLVLGKEVDKKTYRSLKKRLAPKTVKDIKELEDLVDATFAGILTPIVSS